LPVAPQSIGIRVWRQIILNALATDAATGGRIDSRPSRGKTPSMLRCPAVWRSFKAARAYLAARAERD